MPGNRSNVTPAATRARTFVGFLLVTDAALAKEFYCDVLGLPVQHEDDFAVTVALTMPSYSKQMLEQRRHHRESEDRSETTHAAHLDSLAPYGALLRSLVRCSPMGSDPAPCRAPSGIGPTVEPDAASRTRQ